MPIAQQVALFSETCSLLREPLYISSVISPCAEMVIAIPSLLRMLESCCCLVSNDLSFSLLSLYSCFASCFPCAGLCLTAWSHIGNLLLTLAACSAGPTPAGGACTRGLLICSRAWKRVEALEKGQLFLGSCLRTCLLPRWRFPVA